MHSESGLTASSITVAAAETPWWRGITRYQWIVLWMTFGGLMFDLMAANLMAVALAPALRDLLGSSASTQSVGWYGGLVTTIFLVGWALGGMLFGVFADYYGRKTALLITILLYSVFTGLSAVAHTWWTLAIFRFFTALGIGGEWGAGTTLLAETWPEKARVKGAIILQSGSAVGGLVASSINIFFGGYGWRYIFLVGAFPGVLLLALRWWVKESDRWLAVQHADQKSSSLAQGKAHPDVTAPEAHAQSRGFTLKEIFSGSLWRDTVVGTLLATIISFGFWSVGWFIPTMVSELMTQGSHHVAQSTVIAYVSDSRMLLDVGSLVIYAIFLCIGTQWRRKRVLLFFYVASFISTMVVLSIPNSLHTLLILITIMGIFTLGVWAIFPVYLPELFPTRLRATGAGFCFTSGRALTAIGPMVTGALIAHTGSFSTAMRIPAFIYLLGPIVLLFARETKGQTLQ